MTVVTRAFMPINTVPAPDADGGGTTSRFVALDAARFIAACGVIWIHGCQNRATASFADLGRFAVPFFSAAAAFFLVTSLTRRPPPGITAFAWTKIRRLYFPFLVWSVIYIAFKAGGDLIRSAHQPQIPGWEFFVVGGAYHLWFIPYLLAASLAIYGLARIVGRERRWHKPAAVGSYLIGAGLAVYLSTWPIGDSTLSYMLNATPALLWGCALAWVLEDAGGRVSQHKLVSLAAIAVFIVCQGLLFGTGRNLFLESAAGMGLLVVGLDSARPRLVARLAILGEVALGIYFSHLLFLKIGEAAADRWGVVPGIGSTLTLIFVSGCLAGATSLLLSRSRWTGRLVH